MWIKKNGWGLGIGDWGLGIGDWGLGIGPIPNPQSPIPNPQFPKKFWGMTLTFTVIKNFLIYNCIIFEYHIFSQ